MKLVVSVVFLTSSISSFFVFQGGGTDFSGIIGLLLQAPLVGLFIWYSFKKDQNHRDDYRELADEYREALHDLKTDYTASLKSLEQEIAILRSVVSEHAKITELVDYIISHR